MARLSDILKEMNDEVSVQHLGDSFVNIENKTETKDTEITFATNEVNCSSFFHGNKTGMVIWFDKDDYNKAITKLNDAPE